MKAKIDKERENIRNPTPHRRNGENTAVNNK